MTDTLRDKLKRLGHIFQFNADTLVRLIEQHYAERIKPVPVSERLPGAQDCDAEGRCWWWYPEVPGKTYGYWAHEDDAVPERALSEQPLHWLPAHALPIPSVEKSK